jgi:hypothetical protein
LVGQKAFVNAVKDDTIRVDELGKKGRKVACTQKVPIFGDGESNMITIRRLPLFDFLEIPEALAKSQFRVPSGCVITKK